MAEMGPYNTANVTEATAVNAPVPGEWRDVKAKVILNEEAEKIVRFPSFFDRGRFTTATFCPITPLEKRLCTSWSVNAEVPVRVRWLFRFPDEPSRWEAYPMPMPVPVSEPAATNTAEIKAKSELKTCSSPKVNDGGSAVRGKLGPDFIGDLESIGKAITAFTAKFQKKNDIK